MSQTISWCGSVSFLRGGSNFTLSTRRGPHIDFRFLFVLISILRILEFISVQWVKGCLTHDLQLISDRVFPSRELLLVERIRCGTDTGDCKQRDCKLSFQTWKLKSLSYIHTFSEYLLQDPNLSSRQHCKPMPLRVKTNKLTCVHIHTQSHMHTAAWVTWHTCTWQLAEPNVCPHLGSTSKETTN